MKVILPPRIVILFPPALLLVGLPGRVIADASGVENFIAVINTLSVNTATTNPVISIANFGFCCTSDLVENMLYKDHILKSQKITFLDYVSCTKLYITMPFECLLFP